MKSLLSSPILNDFRGIGCIIVVILGLIGYVVLDLTGHSSDAAHLFESLPVPALAFVLGLGSDPKSSPDTTRDPEPGGE